MSKIFEAALFRKRAKNIFGKNRKIPDEKKLDNRISVLYNNRCLIMIQAFGPVVQLVRTLACHARGRRFEPVPGRHAAMAQAVERILGKDEVSSSNLDSSSTKNRSMLPFLGSESDFLFAKLKVF